MYSQNTRTVRVLQYPVHLLLLQGKQAQRAKGLAQRQNGNEWGGLKSWTPDSLNSAVRNTSS